MENKIHFAKFLKDKIDERVKELLLLLILRFYGEEILREKQNRRIDCLVNTNENEESEYKIIMIYAYYLGCMKFPAFDPDSVFRIKLMCPVHQNRVKKHRLNSVCPCLYDMHEETTLLLMKSKTLKKQLIQIEKRKWFVESEETGVIRLKYESKD